MLNFNEYRAGNVGYGISSIHVPYEFPDGGSVEQQIKNFNGICVVAEAPGKTEEEQKTPLVGISGKKFDKWLEQSKIDRNYTLITNIFCFRPDNNRVDNFFITASTAKQDSIPVARNRSKFKGKYLHARFNTEIETLERVIVFLFKPKVIITMGAVATWALTGDDTSISELADIPIKKKMLYKGYNHRTTIIPTFHPSSVLYDPSSSKEEIILSSLKQARKIANK